MSTHFEKIKTAKEEVEKNLDEFRYLAFPSPNIINKPNLQIYSALQAIFNYINALEEKHNADPFGFETYLIENLKPEECKGVKK